MAKFDLSALDDAINKMTDLGEQSPEILADTLNYGGQLAIDAAEQMISSELNLEPDYIRGKISLRKRATATNFTATVSANRRGLLLSRFDAKQQFSGGKRAGISLKVKKRGARKTMKSAFFIKLKRRNERGAGATGIAIRPGDGVTLNRAEKLEANRFGYAVLHGPSVSQALETMSEHIEIDNQSLISFFLKRLQQ